MLSPVFCSSPKSLGPSPPPSSRGAASSYVSLVVPMIRGVLGGRRAVGVSKVILFMFRVYRVHHVARIESCHGDSLT